jgi:cytochrome d ubiquinol oxidase subunit I
VGDFNDWTAMDTFSGLESTLLARIQFAFTISFHIIFPAFTIGLSVYIATLEILWVRTGHAHYRTLARFWTKIQNPARAVLPLIKIAERF